jgi:hypothetical protein
MALSEKITSPENQNEELEVEVYQTGTYYVIGWSTYMSSKIYIVSQHLIFRLSPHSPRSADRLGEGEKV